MTSFWLSLSSIYWDPNPNVFVIPYFDHPLRWYGLLFALGFVGAFILALPLLRQKLSKRKLLPPKVSSNDLNSIAYNYLDKLLWFIVIGTLIGARLGHVFFYEWPRYSANPIEILKIWEGGLASHGGTLGVIVAVYFYAKLKQREFPEISFLGLCDLLTIPAAFICVFIRFGNFINQEILGTATTLPWAVTFGHPADGSIPIPRHPVQLYEAIAYLATLGILWQVWKRKSELLPDGFMTGLLFVLIFGSRFFLEFFKEHQSIMIDENFIQTGQLLSLPFVIAGIALMVRSLKKMNKPLISTAKSDRIKLP